jgi:hypothetical protein
MKTEQMKTYRINSEPDAWAYWEEEYGSPKFFSAFTELTDVEIKLAELQLEQEKINKEIKNRDVSRMNEYTINRAIELHFLVTIGVLYFEQCIRATDKEEELREHEFDSVEDRWREDSLFPRDYED